MTSNLRELAPELAKQAEAELNEVSSRTAEDLKTLREWIAKQPHLTARTGGWITEGKVYEIFLIY